MFFIKYPKYCAKSLSVHFLSWFEKFEDIDLAQDFGDLMKTISFYKKNAFICIQAACTLRHIRIFTLYFQDYAKDCIEKHNMHLSLGINTIIVLKFIYSEKTENFCEIFTFLLSYVVPVKCKVRILQNFVAFSEYMNFPV